MFRRGLLECENMLPSSEISWILKEIISRKILAALKVKMGRTIFDI